MARKKYSPEFFEATLIKIDVDIDELRRAAPLTPILAEAEGGLDAVLAAMRFSQDPTITKFLKVYDSGNVHDKVIVPWEAWAIKARLDISALLGSILIALRQQSVNVIKVLSITAHPETIRARIKSAKTPKGVKDRDALDTALGFLPAQKGTTFIGKYFAGTQGADPEEPGPAAPTPSPARPDEIDVDDLFPDVESTQRMLGNGN